MRRAGVVFSLIATIVALVGCASEDHTWQGEFTARLEGAAAVIEEVREEAHPNMSQEEFFELMPLGGPLFFKAELIKELEPPAGCEAVQVKGKAAVSGAGDLIMGAFENLTPQLERTFSARLEEDIATIEKREREAARCGTGAGP
jgi:hypothetical protein